eukprot:6214846-Pleurochrysis_carterae.AAC.2
MTFWLFVEELYAGQKNLWSPHQYIRSSPSQSSTPTLAHCDIGEGGRGEGRARGARRVGASAGDVSCSRAPRGRGAGGARTSARARQPSVASRAPLLLLY